MHYNFKVSMIFTCLIIAFNISSDAMGEGDKKWFIEYGGNDNDFGYDIAQYGDYIYLTGTTASGSGIATPGAHQANLNGNTSAFLAKFDAEGNRIWSTYYGGEGNDEGFVVETDENGFVYIAGKTNSNDFIATAGSHQDQTAGNNSGFLVKFDSEGNRIWGTYFGGDRADEIWGIHADENNVFITGATNSNDGIATVGAFQSERNNEFSSLFDAFLARFSNDGSLEWATYYGGDNEDVGTSVISDNNGDIYLLGNSNSEGMATSGVHQPELNQHNAILAKFNSDGDRLWATYFGGVGHERTKGIALDDEDNVYFSGTTNSHSSIATPWAYKESIESNLDGFVAKVNSQGSVQWATYTGQHNDFPLSDRNLTTSIKVKDNIVYVLGSGLNIFKTDGNFISHSNHMGYAITVDTKNDIYLAGRYRDDENYFSATITKFPQFPKIKLQRESIHINNIKALVANDGLWFENINMGTLESITRGFEVPAGENTHTIFASSLWIGGYDAGGNLYTSAQTYRQMGTDFDPGPLKPGTGEAAPRHEWNRLWKINHDILRYHQNNWDDPDYEMPDVIENWPAHGPDGFAEELAPWFDFSETGVYEPEKGDYPYFLGDEAIYFIVNDNATANLETDGNSLGIEIHGMIYGFNAPEDEVINNTLFLNLNVFNRSDKTYENVLAGIWTDIDVGYAFNNFIGSNAERNMYYSYVGENFDPGEEGYGESPPAQSVNLLNRDLESFIFNNNTFAMNGFTEEPVHYYNLMNARWKDNSPLCYGGNGFNNCWDETREVNHMYPDDPREPRGNDENWSEVTANNIPFDRRGVGSFSIGEFAPGDNIEIDVAYVYARSEDGHLESLGKLFDNQEIVSAFYDTAIVPSKEPQEIEVSIWKFAETKPTSVTIYPNPAGDEINIELSDLESGVKHSVLIFDAKGQLFRAPVQIDEKITLPISDLPPGLYHIRVETENGIGVTRQFIKK